MNDLLSQAYYSKVISVLFLNSTFKLLSRFVQPDTSSFTDSEIVWRMNKPWHIGLIVAADSRERLLELLDAYTQRISNKFHASAPAPDVSV